MWESILSTSYINVLELLAAIAGCIYLKRIAPRDFTKHLVTLLWVTVVVEIFAHYTAIAYYSNYRFLSFVQNTPFERNYWLYNIFTIYQFFVLVSFFRSKLQSQAVKRVLKVLLVLFLLISVFSNFWFDWYFTSHSPVILITGSLILFASIGCYYLEILRSDKILYFYKLLPFYISVGVLVFFLCVTPLFIYSTYFKSSNGTYILLHKVILYTTNTFMYGFFIYGFLRCSRTKNSEESPFLNNPYLNN